MCIRDREVGKEVKKGKKKTNGCHVLKPDDVDETVWIDFLAVRAKKRAPLTATAWDGIMSEVEKSGWPVEKALRKCCERGWQGFEAKWVDHAAADGTQPYEGIRSI